MSRHVSSWSIIFLCLYRIKDMSSHKITASLPKHNEMILVCMAMCYVLFMLSKCSLFIYGIENKFIAVVFLPIFKYTLTYIFKDQGHQYCLTT